MPADYDAVVMLTWSNWATEPRSNRYHYASRFARRVPVLFLQPTLNSGTPIRIDGSGIEDLDIVNVPNPVDATVVERILALLRERGIRRPLLWVYSSFHYGELMRAMPRAFRVYHATEDYLTVWPQLDAANQAYVAQTVRELMPHMDLLAGVSQKVIDSYVQRGGFVGPTVLAPNGCDAPFFERLRKEHGSAPESRVCIFQGGMNRRLDGELMLQVIQRLPDWQFWFCGAVEKEWAAWPLIVAQPNVKHFGAVPPEEFGRLMCRATVGWIPFAQGEIIWNSLPLKAYEYVSCGLPVVTVPIAALMHDPQLFSIAETAGAFVEKIQAQAATRTDPAALAAREQAAHANSYDGRFETVVAGIARMIAGRTRMRRLNVAVLYDDGSVHVNTVREHVEAFSRYSQHNIFYMPSCVGEPPAFAPATAGQPPARIQQPDFSLFDVLVVHYSVRVSKPTGHMPQAIKDACKAFTGLKVLYIQDEYDFPLVTRRWIQDVGIDLVYTCVPDHSLRKVYPEEHYPDTEFLPTLTGFVPDNPAIDLFARPLSERRYLIGYRGRKLLPIYGGLGYEKYLIGKEVRKLAEARGLPNDIEVEEDLRIYGDDWYRFLSSSRATLGTESGSNLFDWDGSAAALIEAAQQQDPQCDYLALADRLRPYEQDVRMNQISPKIFEAIRTRTALVLFEGSYSGVVTPHLHYLPLKKDYSNFDEIVAKLQDDRFLTETTQRAYADVIESGRYSYRSFVEGFDRDIAQRVQRTAAVQLSALPVLARSGPRVAHLAPSNAAAFLFSTSIVDLGERALLEEYARVQLQAWLVPVPAPVAVPAPQPAEEPQAAAAEAPAAQGQAEPAAVPAEAPAPAPEPAPALVLASFVAARPAPPAPRSSLAVRVVRRAWRMTPIPARALVTRVAKKLAVSELNGSTKHRPLDRAAMAVWRITPARAKRALLRVARDRY